MALKFIYTIFIGVLFAAFVGFGIAAFYESPNMPEYPSSLKVPLPESCNENIFQELREKQESYDSLFKKYQVKQELYNRNVSIIAVAASILTVIISLTLFKKILLIADGLLVGGILTLLYGIIRGFDTGDNKFRFIVVSCGLIISLILGHMKFIKPFKSS